MFNEKDKAQVAEWEVMLPRLCNHDRKLVQGWIASRVVLTDERRAALMAIAHRMMEGEKSPEEIDAALAPVTGETEGDFRDRMQSVGYASFWATFARHAARNWREQAEREARGAQASEFALALLRGKGYAV